MRPIGHGAWMMAMGLLVAGSAAAQQAPAPLAVAIGANMNHVPSFVAVEKGIYLKHGIDVKVKLLATGQEMAKAMQAGEVQLIGAAFSNFPVAVERGLAAKGVVGLMGDRTTPNSDENVAVVSRRATGISKIEDLKGRKLGLAMGGTGDEYVTVLLKKAGITREQVNYINVPPGSQLAALQGGSVDAIAAWEPFPTLILEKVPDAVLVARGGRHIPYIINMSALVDYIEKRPEVLERYVAAMAEASQYTRQHLDEAAEISTRWVPGLDLAVSKKSIRYMTFDPRITSLTIQAFEENAKILVEQKKLKAPMPWRQAMETKFIEKVMKTHPQFFADLKPAP
jgi:ABC-type nitrate/sulfonate/bicarbonate transport system substrate-binding protein